MPRQEKDCPIPGCSSQKLKKLSNHLSQIHGLDRNERQKWLNTSMQMARPETTDITINKQNPCSAVVWAPDTDSTDKKNWWMTESLIPFKSCSSMIVSGSSRSGKTTYVFKLLKHRGKMFVPNAPTEVLYCYGVYQTLFDEMKQVLTNITFHEGLKGCLHKILSKTLPVEVINS